MKLFVVASLFLASACSASILGAVSSQYHTQDLHGGYSYGYADPNSQKHEVSHNGHTSGAYSYVDGHGLVQSVHYTADPVHGFRASGTNLPKGPDAHVTVHAPVHYAAYAPVHHYSAVAPVHYAVAAHSPVHLTHAGVPVDTPEVQHAKAAHFAAVAQAQSHSHDHYDHAHYDNGHYDNGHYAGHYDDGSYNHHDW